MKKIIFLMLMLFTSITTSFAQYEPKAGDFSTEISFNPFSNNFETFKLQGSKFKGVVFLDDVNALRFSVGVGYNVDTDRASLSIPQKDNYQTVSQYNYAVEIFELNKKDFTRKIQSELSLNLGYEYHFKSLKRLDAYMGFEAGFDYKYNREYSEDNRAETSYKDSDPYVKLSYLDTKTETVSKYAVNANIFTGVNFYVYRSLYLGAELGFGMNYSFSGNEKNEWTTTNPDAKIKNSTSEVDIKDDKFHLGFYCDPSLHIGWTF